MRKNFGAKAYLYPQPVLIIATYGEDGTPDAMNAAWGGICDDTRVNICLGSNHKTAANLQSRKAFTVSVGTLKQLVACDYVGLVSGNKVSDKFAQAGFHAVKSTFVDAPLIAEMPFTLECSVVSYDTESCQLVGEIVNVSADESILTEGKIDVAKLEPISFDPVNHTYLKVGTVVGTAFSDGLKLKK
ncbi:MAG: flavin reductase family protein [Fibrobacteraceae bacterium]|nr:flavin reductase family protein [Fibrobacteraceae bacterium]